MMLYACFSSLIPLSFTSLIPLTHHPLEFSFPDLDCVGKKPKRLSGWLQYLSRTLGYLHSSSSLLPTPSSVEGCDNPSTGLPGFPRKAPTKPWIRGHFETPVNLNSAPPSWYATETCKSEEWVYP